MTRGAVADVAIVGAGMVGATLALALSRAGFSVALVESRAPPAWNAKEELDLRVVALAPSAVKLFTSVDIWTAIASARVSAYRKMIVWDALAPGQLGFDAADAGEATLGYIVENRLLQSVLWSAVQNVAQISLSCLARVETMTDETDRRVLVLDDGTRLAARLVVGADGPDSSLRELLGIAVRQRDYAQRAIVAHVATTRSHEFTAWQRFVPGGTLALLPLADGRSSIVWSVPVAEADRLLAMDDAQFCAELGAAFDFRLGTINSTTPRAGFALRMRSAERYIAPRFAMVGDAAHVVHPLAGQGVNLGLRDAAELSQLLIAARAAKRDIASVSLLRTYERRRRADNVLSAHAFDAIQRMFASDSPAVAALRGAGLSLVDRIAPLKQLFADHAAGR